MFCPNCGADLGEGTVCPNCTAEKAEYTEQAELAPPAECACFNECSDSVECIAPAECDDFCCPDTNFPKRPSFLKPAFSDTLFLVMCILLSASTLFSVLSVLGGGTFTLPVINILFIIALWLVFASAKNEGAPLSSSGLKLASGTTTAVFVIYWVIVGFCALGAIAFLALSAGSTSAYIGKIIAQSIFDYTDIILPFETGVFASVMFIILAVIFLIGAAVMILINLFFVRNLKKFIQSVRTSADTGVMDIQKASTVSKWLIVIAVFSGISTLSGFAVFDGSSVLICLASCCETALAIVACIWVKRHFVNPFKPISF